MRGILSFGILSILSGTSAFAATFNVSSSDELFAALRDVAAAPTESHTINLSNSFALTRDMPPVMVDDGISVSINGNGNTINGQNQFRPFFLHRGSVAISNLTIHQGAAVGGNGSGGGLGAGGAIFVDQFATVQLSGVTFTDNTANGGNGGRRGIGGGGLGGNAGFDTGIIKPDGPAQEGHSGGGGGLYGTGGTAFEEGGGGGGGALGNGGMGSLASGLVGAGGGGGFFGNGGNGSNQTGGGGGGRYLDGTNANGGTAGQGGGPEGGDGGGDGQNGFDFGGGGGGGGGRIGGNGGFGGGGGGSGDDGGAGGNGGYFGGGGGADYGNGGNGGDFGGGGGTDPGRGGNGGFGGGGGGSLSSACNCQVFGIGGDGGFGAGGGAGPIGGGIAGLGGGIGSTTGGGGGAAMGGSIFVRQGGSLSFGGSGSISGGQIVGGLGSGAGGNGAAYGNGLFLHGYGNLTFAPAFGQTITIHDKIADSVGSTGINVGAWSVTKNGGGLLHVLGSQQYKGATQILGGELRLDGSVLSGVDVAALGTLSGYAVVGEDLSNSNGGAVAPGHGIGTITVQGNYFGGGFLNLDVNFAQASSPLAGTTNDLLSINGDVFGQTNINLTNLSLGPSAATTGLGVLLVQVGGTTASNAFQLAGGPQNIGGVNYELVHIADFHELLDGFFLQSFGCLVSANNDVCIIDATTNQSVAIDAQAGLDTLQLSGAVNFQFDVARIGTTYNNFEVLEKIGTSSVTLIGESIAPISVVISQGVLSSTSGNNISDTSSVDIALGALLELGANESIGSLSGSGGVNLGPNTLSTGENNSSSVFSGSVTGTGGLTKIGSGNQTLSGINSFLGPININDGTLTASGGSAITNSSVVGVGALGSFAVSTSEQIGRLTGSGTTLVQSGATLTTGDASNHSYMGTIGGAGALTKLGVGKFSTLGIGLTGLKTVTQGELNTNGSIAGDVLVNAGATLSGNFDIAGNLTSFGTVSPGNSPGSSSIGSLAGATAITSEVIFNSANAPINGASHDFLNVSGNVSGNHVISVVPFAPSDNPQQTTSRGMELVRVGGSVSANAFTLAGPVIFGGLEYLLQYAPDYSGTMDGFFLQSAPIQELALSTALISAGQRSLGHCMPEGRTGSISGKNSAWSEASFGSWNTKEGNGIEADETCVKGGANVSLGGGLQVGLSGSMVQSDAEITLPQGRAHLDGDSQLIQVTGTLEAGGGFWSVAAGYARTDWLVVKTNGNAVSAIVDGLIASFRTGYEFELVEIGKLTLGAELAYNGTECGNGCLQSGAVQETTDWLGKVDATVQASLYGGRLSPFLKVALSDDLGQGTTLSFGGVTTRQDIQSAVLDTSIGVDVRLASNISGYARGAIRTGIESDLDGYQGDFGIRLSW